MGHGRCLGCWSKGSSPSAATKEFEKCSRHPLQTGMVRFGACMLDRDSETDACARQTSSSMYRLPNSDNRGHCLCRMRGRGIRKTAHTIWEMFGMHCQWGLVLHGAHRINELPDASSEARHSEMQYMLLDIGDALHNI